MSDPRRQRTVDALLRAGEELFTAHAAEDVTVGDLAGHAGVAVSSIYNTFGSKAALYAAVVDRALDVDREYMDRAYTADRTPIEQLQAAAEEYLRFALDHPRFFRMLAFPSEAGSFPAAAETAARLARRVDEQNARMVDALERGIADGSVRELDPHVTATALWASFNGMISLAWRPDALRHDEAGLRRVLAAAGELMGRGLRA